MNNNRDFFLRPNQGDRDSRTYGRTGPIADEHESWNRAMWLFAMGLNTGAILFVLYCAVTWVLG